MCEGACYDSPSSTFSGDFSLTFCHFWQARSCRLHLFKTGEFATNIKTTPHLFGAKGTNISNGIDP